MKQRHCQVWGRTISVVEPKPEVTTSESSSWNLPFQSLFQLLEKNQHSIWMKLSTSQPFFSAETLKRDILRSRASAKIVKWGFSHMRTLYLPVIFSSWRRGSPQRAKGGRKGWENRGWWVLDRDSHYWRDKQPIKGTSAYRCDTVPAHMPAACFRLELLLWLSNKMYI